MTFTQACETAQKASLADGCLVHVCAKLKIVDDRVVVDPNGFDLSDWYDGSVVRSYNNGKVKE